MLQRIEAVCFIPIRLRISLNGLQDRHYVQIDHGRSYAPKLRWQLRTSSHIEAFVSTVLKTYYSRDRIYTRCRKMYVYELRYALGSLASQDITAHIPVPVS